jgi:hypothetical protein
MKKPAVLFLAALLNFFAVQSIKADTVAGWTFQTSASTNALFARIAAGAGVSVTNMSADVGSGTASGSHASASTVWSSPSGNGSTNSLASEHWAINDYYQFAANTTAGGGNFFTNLSVSFDITRSATGPSNFVFQYSADGSSYSSFGANFMVQTNGGASGFSSWAPGTPASGYSISFDLSSLTALANDPTASFRLVDLSAPSGTAGTLRVDNFLVSGTLITVPEPSSLALAAMGGAAFLVAFRRRR